MKNHVIECPLCQSTQYQKIDQDKLRSFYQCYNCQLIFVPRNELISFEDEKKRYDHHQNLLEDSGYQGYISEIVKVISTELVSGEAGLDFGCGAVTLMGNKLTEAGFPTSSYDYLFHPDEKVFQEKYDFIVMSEVIEHLRELTSTMQIIRSLLKENGKIFIKTKFYPEVSQFKNWFYKRDITHIQFFNESSLKLAFPKMSYNPLGEDIYFFSSEIIAH